MNIVPYKRNVSQIRPKITMISMHCCIRVLKEAIALKNYGYEVHGILQSTPAIRGVFSTIMSFTNTDELQAAVRASSSDLFHVHNEPDWIVPIIKYCTNKKPIIWDIHDPEHLRGHEPFPEEISSITLADGLVHVSEPCRKSTHEVCEYDKPECVLYSMVNEQLLAPDNSIIPDPSFKSIVYEGGIDGTEVPEILERNVAGENIALARVNLRYIIDAVRAFYNEGYSFTIFCAKLLKSRIYEEAGAFVVKPTIYPQMLTALRPHGLGFNGSVYDSLLLQNAMPNKLWEYISQGVVPVCLNTQESAKICKEYDMGIELKSLKNISEQLADAPQKRKNLLKVRKQFTMEREIPQLMNLYEKVLSNEKA